MGARLLEFPRPLFDQREVIQFFCDSLRRNPYNERLWERFQHTCEFLQETVPYVDTITTPSQNLAIYGASNTNSRVEITAYTSSKCIEIEVTQLLQRIPIRELYQDKISLFDNPDGYLGNLCEGDSTFCRSHSAVISYSHPSPKLVSISTFFVEGDVTGDPLRACAYQMNSQTLSWRDNHFQGGRQFACTVPDLRLLAPKYHSVIGSPNDIRQSFSDIKKLQKLISL